MFYFPVYSNKIEQFIFGFVFFYLSLSSAAPGYIQVLRYILQKCFAQLIHRNKYKFGKYNVHLFFTGTKITSNCFEILINVNSLKKTMLRDSSLSSIFPIGYIYIFPIGNIFPTITV